jgi:peptidoglycan/LPS O-acetylase OafA/YrhL
MISLTAQNPSVSTEDGTTRASGAERRYRPELQGLRALAVALVVVYHVWLGRVSGGVDVFFVISGFLITGQLFRAAARDGFRGRIEFPPLWTRMIKRLFPAATVVLLVTVAASVLLLPQTRWFATIREVGAAALYLENWVLATPPRSRRWSRRPETSTYGTEPRDHGAGSWSQVLHRGDELGE